MIAALLSLALGAPPSLTGPAAEQARALLPAITSDIDAALGPVSWSDVSVQLTTSRADSRPPSVPTWAAAFAFPARGEVVIYTDRVGPYPHSSLRQVLTHELTHIAIFRQSGGRDLPRWFDEGLSMSVAREVGIDDAFHLSLGMVFGPELPIATLDERFLGEHSTAQAAYAVSASLVRAMEDGPGSDLGRRVLERIAAGDDFEGAVAAATSRTLAAIEHAWSVETSFRYRWLPLITSGTLLWIGVGLLALAAVFRHRRRLRERALAWEIEEGLALDPPDDRELLTALTPADGPDPGRR